MYVCMYVCMYASKHACMHACMLCYSLHLGPQTFSSSSTTPKFFFKIHPAITLSMNNRITLCNFYVQLSTTLHNYIQLLTTSCVFSMIVQRSHQDVDWQHQVDISVIMLCILKSYSHIRTKLPSYLRGAFLLVSITIYYYSNIHLTFTSLINFTDTCLNCRHSLEYLFNSHYFDEIDM